MDWLFLIIALLPAVLFGAHLLLRWLERRGWIYYRRSGSGARAAMMELATFIEPGVSHVREAEEAGHAEETDAGGSDDPCSDAVGSPAPPGGR